MTKTHWLSRETSDLYCQCTDAECGCSWVATRRNSVWHRPHDLYF
ncbi:ogr/Delta-like zinc finger family protein [Aeromonas rivuli]